MARLRKQQVAHFHLGLMKLRFRISDRASELARDFVMLKSLNFVEIKDLTAALGKFLDGAA